MDSFPASISTRLTQFFWVMACLVLALQLPAQTWRSTLYPEDWQRPEETASFYNDKLIQDFSYAGYRNGGEDIPEVAGPVFDASSYGADPTGTADSTVAIQSVIDAAETAGGGVVFIPSGLYRISPQGSNSYCLRISASNVVLRGAGAASTRLLNTSTDMRGKRVILIQPASTGTGPEVNLTADLEGPTRRLPVATPEDFAPGDIVRLQWSFTDAWIAEHNQQRWWNATKGRPSDAQYHREVVASNVAEGWIEVDAPTRYTLKARDNARIMARTGLLSGVGIESLAIGNVQHPGTTWGESDYTDPTKPAYDVHGSYLLYMTSVYDCWITGVESFQPVGNTSTCHMLSNGIAILYSMRVTVRDCKMSRPQYGGGGGNGYMFRLQYSNECLLQNCIADFSRHGLVVGHAGTSGNVFLNCEDRETQRATGHTGQYTTSGSGSDNHMHFSHSNLWDGCHADNSFYTAHHRQDFGTVPHALTSAHGVYWNTSGSGTRYNTIVESEQARYGYVIGTSGSKFGASNPTGGQTAPADHLEGIGGGTTLEPASLYLDQLSRRLEPRIALTAATIQLPTNTIEVAAVFTIDGEVIDAPTSLSWSVTSNPAGASIVSSETTSGRAFTVTHPGSYSIEASGTYEGKVHAGDIVVEVLPPAASQNFIDLPPVADSYAQSGASAALNFGSNNTLIVKNDGSADWEREAFMRFDLSAIDTAAIEEATLNVYFTTTVTDANGRTSVIDDAGDWGETTLNWNNRPTVQKALVGDWTPAAADWMILDAANLIPSQLESNGSITFRHQILSQSGNAIYSMASRENSDASLHPFLRLRMAPQTLAEWLTDTTELTAPDLDPEDDPDGDGIVNLLEAWLGTHAGQPDSSEMPQAALRDGQMEFDLQVNASPPAGLFYYLEYSDTLGDDWQPAPGVVWEPDGPVVNGRQPMTARVAFDSLINKRFYRFVVVAP